MSVEPARRAKTRSTEVLSKYCAGFSYDSLPIDAVERAKRVILDGIGCGLFGSTLPWSRLLADTVTAGYQQDPAGNAPTLWGHGVRVTADQAALLNGSFIQSFEIDDYSREGAFHGCAVLLPALFAALPRAGKRVSGKKVIEAVTLGLEVGMRVGRTLNSSLILERGWHSGSVIGTPASAAAVARMLDLDSGAFNHAFGLAATQACGLMSSQYGSMVKRMNHGRAAQNGYYAGTLAAAGYTGILDVFDLEYSGFVTTFRASDDLSVLASLEAPFGERPAVMETCIKPYACNASIHPSIDAVLELGLNRVDPAEIESISVGCTMSTLGHVGWPYAASGSATEAQMNLSFAVACAILFGDAFVEQYQVGSLKDARIIELTQRVTVHHDPEFDNLGPKLRHRTRLTARMRDGSTRSTLIDDALGSARRPLSNAEIEAKFDKVMKAAGEVEWGAAVKQAVLSLERMQDVTELDALLGRRAEGTSSIQL